jgi:hypothetical protein
MFEKMAKSLLVKPEGPAPLLPLDTILSHFNPEQFITSHPISSRLIFIAQKLHNFGTL